MKAYFQPGPDVARLFPDESLEQLLEAAQARSVERLNSTIRDLKIKHPELFRPEALQDLLPKE